MQKKDLRTRVTTGTYTLPAMTALTAVLWVAPDAGSWRLWAGLIAAAWTAFQLIELNNRCTLLRVRSRMVSVAFLGLLLVLPAAHFILTCQSSSLFRQYQLPRLRLFFPIHVRPDFQNIHAVLSKSKRLRVMLRQILRCPHHLLNVFLFLFTHACPLPSFSI